MLFNEMYGAYYRAVHEILRAAKEGPVSRGDMVRICNQYAFGEAALNVPQALLSGKWPLLTADGRSALKEAPEIPLTLLEKRWLKAISLDPRVQLFDIDLSFLGKVEPLFTQEDVICFDSYKDGDDYSDPAYQANFRLLLRAIGEGRDVRLTYTGRKGKGAMETVAPLRLEYSEKDDRFRVLCASGNDVKVYNLSGVSECELGEVHQGALPDPDQRKARYVVLEVSDYRKAMERVSMHFTHLHREVERVNPFIYRMKIWYDPKDEPEMIVRVLQFGSAVKVLESGPREAGEKDSFLEEVKRRIREQLALSGVQIPPRV